jgi:hypothetical protein
MRTVPFARSTAPKYPKTQDALTVLARYLRHTDLLDVPTGNFLEAKPRRKSKQAEEAQVTSVHSVSVKEGERSPNVGLNDA